MKKIYSILHVVILFSILSVTGCSNVEKKQAIIKPEALISMEAIEDQLSVLMLDYARIEKRNDSELVRLFDTVKAAFENDPNSDNRIRYVLLLILSDQKFYDRDTALALLKEWPEAEQLPLSLNSFRKILLMRLEEERHLKKMINQLSQQLANEKSKFETLQKKVDEIKDMERSLIRRNMP